VRLCGWPHRVRDTITQIKTPPGIGRRFES
jgi:hypothetical protein